MRESPEITIPVLTKETGITICSVERAIEKLIKSNGLERIKVAIGGFYRMISYAKLI